MKTIKDFNFRNKYVLVRCDFDVPVSRTGDIVDDFRIKQSIPTIKYLIKERARVILISHLGRPKKRELRYSLKPVAQKLEKLLKQKVKFLNDCIGAKVKKETEKMKPGEIILLENLRFYEEETKRDLKFAERLSQLADIYINEAFAVCHRNHASLVDLPKFLPSGAGFLLEKEICVLGNLMKKAKKPLIVIIGGKKVETKAKLIDKISFQADSLLINGLIQKELKEKRISLKYPQKIIKPVDEIKGKDIGPKTIKLFRDKIKGAKTIFWNGPLGMIEKQEFSKGSKEIAKAIIKSPALSVIGGGETLKFLNEIGLLEKFNHASVGGGAMLAFLSGEKLPGIKALK